MSARSAADRMDCNSDSDSDDAASSADDAASSADDGTIWAPGRLTGYCYFCNQYYEHPSIVAYFLADTDHPFALLREPPIQQGIVSIYDCRLAHPGCAWCASRFHKRNYVEDFVNPEGDTIVKTTKLWNRLRERSRHGLTSAQIRDVHVSNDWVMHFGGGSRPLLWILHGCRQCGMWTVRPEHFWHVQRRESSTSAPHGHSRCCGCFSKWS